MKRTLAFLLALVMLCAAACGGGSLTPVVTGEEETAATAQQTETGADYRDPTGFAVGYARVDITPTESVPLAGFGKVERRLSEKVLDPLYVTCVAFSDGERAALVFTLDIVTIPERVQENVRAAVARQTGVSEDLISFTATHTHSGPAITSDLAQSYYDKLFQNVLTAGKAALADLDRAELSWGTAETENLNFVRRYLLADGTYSQNNSGDYPSPVVAHESEADPEMRILYVKRVNTKDVVLVNWQVHPTFTGSETKTDVSADTVGAFREWTEEELGVNFAYFQGAAGNLNPKSQIASENRTSYYKEHGKLLYETLKTGLENLTPVASGKIRSIHRVFTGTINHEGETPERIAQAREVSDALNKSYDDARAVAAKYDFPNFFSATALLSRMKMGETKDMDLYAFAIGDFAFTTNPYEMFDTNGMELRAASPYACTMNFGYSNGHNGYIPSAAGYEHYGYEGSTSRFVPGTGELVAAELADMLEALHAGA